MKTNNNYQIKIINNKLILSLLDAKAPLIACYDLNHKKEIIVKIKEDKKSYQIISNLNDNEEEQVIATYQDKEVAFAILKEIATVLGANKNTAKKNNSILGFFKYLLIILISLFLIISLYGFLGNAVLPITTDDIGLSGPAPSGVAVDADDFLSNR